MKVNPDPENDGVVIKLTQDELIALKYTILMRAKSKNGILGKLEAAIAEYYESFPKD